MIGIRLADSTFFSICSDGPEKKRVVLSPANRNQKKAKIDLFRYDTSSDKDGYHIGSLFLDPIGYDDAGDSEIELFVDTDGKKIRAVATDLRGGGKDEFETQLPGIIPAAGQVCTEKKCEPEPVAVKGIRSLQVMMVLLLLMMAFVTGMLLYSMISDPCIRNVPEYAEVPAPELAPAPQPIPTPQPQSQVTPAPSSQPETAAPAPKPEPTQEYIRYTVKYGDTLWSLAKDFCKDPYMYRRIAAENKLESPDKLISGTTLIIPINK